MTAGQWRQKIREVLMTYVHVLGTPNVHSRRIFLQGFDPGLSMRLREQGEKYTGEMLMKCGFLVKGFWETLRVNCIIL